ncbi:PREDICTED: probable tetraacyldisaccharide 4'-kinase, mitochondrial isoform X1 [Nicotiana attenuata]|uniref:probable tetraacyldisaccharide 4'-kinase, mitochondrial isoform X1 n=1 Tax=Nicotiana attenuata TaxID=49451 RepID=UPI000905A7E9|nr:PREDICTED: probable tetraacyldisaccharide 4'-kinase, mitochondrial isoform X1 [Nicotiana attenuata]
MEKLRKMVNQIAYTPPQERFYTLSALQLSLIPLLSLASTLYGFALPLRHRLYQLGLLHTDRLPVPVISVGNLTWGGNGKTPMVEFLALWLAAAGISPLILTRGYGGADEAKMLQRHLYGTPVKIGVGANRAVTAASFLKRYGHISPCKHGNTDLGRLFSDNKKGNSSCCDQIGVAILDDGMQHISLWRDVEIVMVNAMIPWGNHQLIPLGPLREPLTALARADIVVIHHANLISEKDVEAIASEMRTVKNSLPIFLSRLAPLYFLKARNMSHKLALMDICSTLVLCVSAIGSAESFVETIKKLGPTYVDRLDFSDHHLFQAKDIDMIRMRLRNLQSDFAMKPIVVVTEKDYDRAPEVLTYLDPYEVLVLCSCLQILPHKGSTEETFKKCLWQHLEVSCKV